MRILGLDPGLARVGYGVLEVDEQRRNQPEMVDCGIISTDAGRSEGERMVEIARDLRQLLRLHRPQLAAVEKFFFYRSSNTIAVVQARGVLIMTLARFQSPRWNTRRCKSNWPWPARAMPIKARCKTR